MFPTLFNRSAGALLLLAVMACDTPAPQVPTVTALPKPSEAATTAPSPKPAQPAAHATPPGLRHLSVTINDTPLHLASALSYSQGSSATTVVFSTAELTCQDLKGKPAEGEERFDVTIAPILKPDGSRPTQIRQIEHGRSSITGGSNGMDDWVPFEGTVTPSQGVEGKMAFAFETSNSYVQDRHLAVKGTFSSKGCGVMLTEVAGSKPLAAPVPQDGLTLTVAGVAFDIVGAVLRAKTFYLSEHGEPFEGYQLALSTSPMGCDTFQRDRDLYVELEFVEGKHVSSIHIWGNTLFGPLPLNLFDAERPLVVAPARGKRLGSRTRIPAKGETVRLNMDGSREVSDGYVLALKGHVQALRCAPRPWDL